MKHVKKLRKKLYELKNLEGIEFVHGCGKRKTTLQKSIEKLEEYLLKFKEYNKKVYTCGNRNSYSKTDIDATFMRMKEDAMKNGQLKPAYNVQHGVDAEYITWLTVGPEPTDTTTLIPFLKSMEENLNFKYLKIVADAGYESEENYSFIEENNQISFIKPANYEISKTRKYKNDISRIDNMDYDSESDLFICQNGKKLTANGVKIRKSKTGYESVKTIYICEDCSNCNYKSQCIKGNNSKIPLEKRTKKFETSKKFNRQRKEDLERIITDEGILLRMNRSIQAEGSFAQVKHDMNFKRFMCRGQKNVLAESILLAIAHNVNKLHNKMLKSFSKVKSYLGLRKVYKKYEKEFKKIPINKPNNCLKIGIIGELYTIMEPFANYYLEKLLASYNIEIKRFTNVHYLLFEKKKKSKKYIKYASSYVKYKMGSDAADNIGRTKYLCENGYDGIIHIKSSFCTPEIGAMPVINKICNDYNVPVIFFSFDSNTSEVGIKTRIEAFYDMIEMRREHEGMLPRD